MSGTVLIYSKGQGSGHFEVTLECKWLGCERRFHIKYFDVVSGNSTVLPGIMFCCFYQIASSLPIST